MQPSQPDGWCRTYQAAGIETLRDQRAGGNHYRLTAGQKAELADLVRGVKLRTYVATQLRPKLRPCAPKRTVIQYLTATEPGSSGSPVLNDHFEVVGIHHSGGDLLEPDTLRKFQRNAGTTMMAVAEDVQRNMPDLYGQLNF